MNRLALTIIPALLLSAGFCQRTHAQTAEAKKTATVSGRVTIKGKPALDVVVGLRLDKSPQVNSTFRGTTDQDGVYRIINVPAGSYQVAPMAPVFVIQDVNKSYGQNLIIAEGDNITGIDFDLLKGGVITGKVSDADGHPVAEEIVHLLAADDSRPGGFSHVWSNFQTDDRGIYRMFGLRPGRYKVSVGDENLGVNRRDGNGQSLPVTFYPDAAEAVKGAVVEVGEGTEATKIDITVAEAGRSFSASGRVIDGETGKPIPNVVISLSRIIIIDKNSSSSTGGGTDARSNTDGAFRLEKLAAGKYSITIEPPPESNLRAEPVTFDLVDEDVAGLVIKTAIGASLSGTVLLEGTPDRNSTRAAPRWLSVHLRNEALGYSSSQSAEIKPDGSFRIGGLLAGTVIFSVGSWSATGDARPIPISRVERDGVVQTSGLQLQNGEHLAGIRVVAAYASGSIRGIVKVDNGALPADGRLVITLSKVGDSNWNNNGGGIAADARGHFLIEGLATGTYEVRVIAVVRELRQRTLTAKQLITVTDGAATDVMLTIDLTPP